jgi:hypothetical protein
MISIYVYLLVPFLQILDSPIDYRTTCWIEPSFFWAGFESAVYQSTFATASPVKGSDSPTSGASILIPTKINKRVYDKVRGLAGCDLVLALKN